MSNIIRTYFYTTTIDLTLLNGEKLNLPMLRKNIKIYKNVNNRIDFDLKDTDRKPVKLFNKTIVLIFMNQDTRQVVLEKHASIVDERKGLYSVDLAPGDVQEWAPGFYTMGVILRNDEDVDRLLYTDFNQNVIAFVELDNTPLPDFSESFEISNDDFKTHSISNQYSTGRYPGDARRGNRDGLHTAAVYLDDFTGKFWIQGSLEDYPTQDSDYFNIPIGSGQDHVDFAGASGIQDFNFEGSYPWVRFTYEPDGSNTGEITQVLYRS